MAYNPLISIVTIVRNDLRGLKRTFESVMAQDYPNLEYIAIDAASVDGCAEFIESHKEDFFYWVSEPDKGIADGFNKGVSAARGEWIVFLNAGDYFQSPKSVSQMLPYLEANPSADVVYGTLTEVDESGATGKRIGRTFNRRSFERECTIIHPACFHNRVFFQENGLFSLEFKRVMDYEIFLRKADLRAVFADEDTTYMEKGGTSQESPMSAYLEMNRAKRLHLGKSEIALFFDLAQNSLRYAASKLIQRMSVFKDIQA